MQKWRNQATALKKVRGPESPLSGPVSDGYRLNLVGIKSQSHKEDESQSDASPRVLRL